MISEQQVSIDIEKNQGIEKYYLPLAISKTYSEAARAWIDCYQVISNIFLDKQEAEMEITRLSRSDEKSILVSFYLPRIEQIKK